MISAQSQNGPESFIIEIQPDKIEGLLAEFNSQFPLMADHLKLMNNRMVLLNPKFKQGQD